MFDHPWVLFFMVPLAVGYVWHFRSRAGTAVPSLKSWSERKGDWRSKVWWLAEVSWSLLPLICLFLLAGPQRPLEPKEIPSRGLNLAVVLDRSGSMGARLSPEKPETRFEAVKKVLGAFLERRPGDGVTLISFARYPETHTPLTSSLDILRGFLELIPLAVEESESGTAIGDALILAGTRLTEGLPEGENSQGVVLLLTDGRNNAGVSAPEEGARFLAKENLKLYTIGLGGTGYFIQDGIFGSTLAGQTVDLDIPGLKNLAQITGGDYFQADTPGELDSLLKNLESRELIQLSRWESPPKALNLVPGLWILLLLLLAAPGIRWFLLRRDVE